MTNRNYKQIKLSETEELSIIPLLNAENDLFYFSEESVSIKAFELPFFENYICLEVWMLHSTPPISLNYLWNKNDEVIAFNGYKEFIFDNLPKFGLVLNPQTIMPYVRFVLDCIWTFHGSLRLIEDYDEIEFSKKPTPNEQEFLLKSIRRAKITPTENGYSIDAVIVYGDSLFQSNIELQNNGILDIVSETLLCEKYRCLEPIFLE